MIIYKYGVICLLVLLILACSTTEPEPHSDIPILTEEQVVYLVKEKLTSDYMISSKSNDLYDKVSCGVLFDREHIDAHSFSVNYSGNGIWVVNLPSYKLDIKRTVTYSWTVSDEDSSVISTGLSEGTDWAKSEPRTVC